MSVRKKLKDSGGQPCDINTDEEFFNLSKECLKSTRLLYVIFLQELYNNCMINVYKSVLLKDGPGNMTGKQKDILEVILPKAHTFKQN